MPEDLKIGVHSTNRMRSPDFPAFDLRVVATVSLDPEDSPPGGLDPAQVRVKSRLLLMGSLGEQGKIEAYSVPGEDSQSPFWPTLTRSLRGVGGAPILQVSPRIWGRGQEDPHVQPVPLWWCSLCPGLA